MLPPGHSVSQTLVLLKGHLYFAYTLVLKLLWMALFSWIKQKLHIC